MKPETLSKKEVSIKYMLENPQYFTVGDLQRLTKQWNEYEIQKFENIQLE